MTRDDIEHLAEVAEFMPAGTIRTSASRRSAPERAASRPISGRSKSPPLRPVYSFAGERRPSIDLRVCEKVRAGPLTEADLDGFVGRMLWAIHMGAKYSHQFRSHLGNPEQ